MGQAGRRSDTFEWVVPSLPYIIVYQIRDEDGLVDVVAVVHGAQDRDTD